jgi:class 3 adenylate cyclase
MKGQTLQQWAGETRIFALVFTDIVDSTTLANQLHDEQWIEVLLTHFAQARRLMAKYNHHEIKIIGDSFMVAFRDAPEALDFTLALQADTGDDRVKIRAGIHLGQVRIIEDDMFGIMVNYTKRVESTENSHGIRLSDVVRNHIRDEGAQRHLGLGFTELKLNFKGFPERQTIWNVTVPILTLRRESILKMLKVPAEPKRIPVVPREPKSDR